MAETKPGEEEGWQCRNWGRSPSPPAVLMRALATCRLINDLRCWRSGVFRHVCVCISCWAKREHLCAAPCSVASDAGPQEGNTTISEFSLQPQVETSLLCRHSALVSCLHSQADLSYGMVVSGDGACWGGEVCYSALV